jgi:hypothetical protein
MLLLPEGQTGKAWEPSKKPSSFTNLGALDRKSTFTIKEVLALHFCGSILRNKSNLKNTLTQTS